MNPHDKEALRGDELLHPEILRAMNALRLEVDASIVDDIIQRLGDFQPYRSTPPNAPKTSEVAAVVESAAFNAAFRNEFGYSIIEDANRHGGIERGALWAKEWIKTHTPVSREKE